MYDYILAFILNVAVVWVVIQNEDIVRIRICPMAMQHLVMFAVDSCVVCLLTGTNVHNVNILV
jgi:hypothetical protein